MKKYSLLIMCTAMLILASSAMAQLKNRVPDDGTAVALGSMVKLNASGEISVCGDDDDDVAGIVTAIVPDGATNYYLITASDIYPARLSATVTAGDRLTTAAGGALRTAAGGEVTVGWALEDGHATELRKAIISINSPDDGDWADSSTFLMVIGPKGVFGNGNVGYGDHDSTHVNLGVRGITGTSGQNYKYSTVSGGDWNRATHTYSTVGGGYRNIAGSYGATIGGGYNNTTGGSALLDYATIAGGLDNLTGQYGSVGGGYSNSAAGWYGTIAGGRENSIPWTAIHVSIGGGYNNTAASDGSSIGGGYGNNIAPGAGWGVIGGGYGNIVGSESSTIGGGYENRIGALWYSTIAGGTHNEITGGFSAIPGGEADTVSGDYSFAFGRNVTVSSDYTAQFFSSAYPGSLIVGGDVHIENELFIDNVPDDAAPDTILTLSGNQVMKALPADLGDGVGFQQLRADGGAWLTDSVTLVQGSNITLTQTGDSITIAASGSMGFTQLRANGSAWLTDSVTLVDGDVELTQTGDSIAFNVVWDTLGAYADTSVVWDTLAAYSDTTITNLILDSLAVYLVENDTILFSDTAGFAWKIPCDSVNECIVWDTLADYALLDTLGAYADTSIVWDTLAAYSDTTITNLILDSLAVYLVENDTILFSDTAGFAWKIPCDSVNECIVWDTLADYALLDTLGAYADTNVTNLILDSLGAYLDTTYSGDNLGNHIATENLQMSGYWVSNDGGNEGLYVDTDGKVGIGTNSPDEDLEVSSSGFTYIRSTTTADADAGVHLRATNVGSEGGANINQYALFIRGADNSGDFLINEDYIAGAYAPVTRFILENETGNIGIGLGADDPEAKLHVRGDIFVDEGNGFVGANPSGADSFYIYDPGDTTYFHSDNPLLITTQLHLGTVPDDAAPDTILTLSGNQVKKVLASSLGGGGGFTQLRANGSAWLTDSVTLVDGDVELTQTGDSIAFNVVWDTLSAYADTSVVWDTLAAYSDTTVTNLILDSLAVYLVENDTILFSDTAGFAWKIPCDSVNECIVWDTLADYALLDTLGAYADTSVVWDTLADYALLDTLGAYADTSVVWDTLAEYALLDTLGAYLDTTNHFFTQLRANGSAWLPDSVTLVEGTGITLTQTGDSITIAASGGGGSDTDWSGAGTGQMYATDTDDSVAIGIAVPTAKLDVDGGITMRGDRYRGIDASGADSFYIYDDGDTTRFDADNPIKIGDASLVVGTNGYAYATKNLYAGDSFYIGDLEIDTANSVVLVADTATGKVGYAPLNFVGGAITRAYGELVMDDTSGVTVALPNSIAWTDMKTSESGIIAGAPFLTVGAGTNGSTAYADSLIIGDSGAHLYQLNLSVSFSGPSGCEFQMAVLRDGVILPKFMLFSDIASANEKKSSSLSGLIEIDDGEVLTLKMRNYGDKGINITIYNFNLQITRVGD